MSAHKLSVTGIKIGLIGDQLVGKTSICKAFNNIEINPDELQTIGFDKSDKKFTLKNGKNIKVLLFDTSGQEKFHSIALNTIKNFLGVVLVFEMTNRQSFLNIEKWLNETKENMDNPSKVLFGNKIDKEKDKWEVTSEEAKKFAEENNLAYFEISAKTKQGINEGFSYIIEETYRSHEDRINKIELEIQRENENFKKCFGNLKKKKNKSK